MTSLHGSRLSILLFKVWTAANLAAFRRLPPPSAADHGLDLELTARR